MNNEWWKKGTVYQIYPRSFNDTNGDGIGDIRGIIEKLDYLAKLGIDLVWLTPMYVSPQRDNGYDIADYFAIDPQYGTMADFEELLEEAHRRGLKIMMDMVVNHTSYQHHWFQEALKGKDNPYRDYYIWKDPAPDGGPPNNWLSKFSGSAWELDAASGQYYLHLYEVGMPDLNWENPNLQEEIYQMMAWWGEKGIDGFRLDVINNISKNPDFPNDSLATAQDDGRKFYVDGPHVHEYLHQMNRRVFEKYNLVTVGEMSSTTPEQCIKYTHPKREELSMVFNFHHMKVDYPNGKKWASAKYRLSDLKRVMSEWQLKMAAGGGWNALFWTNHDQPRALARFADDQIYREQSAKLLAIILFGLQGTTYIYQGEEIAMTDANFTDISQYDDAESRNAYKQMLADGMPETDALQILREKSRENARIPMQWNDAAHSGFTNGKPWLAPIHKDTWTAEKALVNPDSIFYTYQRLIALRRSHEIFANGDFRLLDATSETIYDYERQWNSETLLVVGNFSAEEQVWNLPERHHHKTCQILESNYPHEAITNTLVLQPYEALLLHIK